MPLRHTSSTADLPAGLTEDWTEFLSSDDDENRTRWRTVMVLGKAPLDFEVRWSGGGGSGFLAFATISTGGQMAVYAKSLRVRCRNRSTNAQMVSVAVADGQAAAENVFERPGVGAIAAPTDFTVPPFAKIVQVEADSDASLVTVRHFDGLAQIKTVYTANLHRDGAYLGGCSKITVEAGAGVRYRVIWGLSL